MRRRRKAPLQSNRHLRRLRSAVFSEIAVGISVLVLTLNEEVNIAGCLESVAWSDDVVVLDSLSSDRTVEIAREHGVRVVQRVFDNYANQRNYGLQDVPYEHDWVLMLDADERVPDDLRAEMLLATVAADESTALFRMRRKDHLFGRWIRGSSGYPTWFGRLARVGRVWVERSINEEYHSDGVVRELHSHLHHYPFSKGISAWLAKHDRYSSMEAQLRFDCGRRAWHMRDLAAGDPNIRRRALKGLVYGLPGRPVLMFGALYFLRGGFLEGRAGLTFSLLRAYYEYLIDCKQVELERRGRGLPV
jgi:glycosyltransferase involved in cell wall biosynthesis